MTRFQHVWLTLVRISSSSSPSSAEIEAVSGNRRVMASASSDSAGPSRVPAGSCGGGSTRTNVWKSPSAVG